jgi:hypothetical protein
MTTNTRIHGLTVFAAAAAALGLLGAAPTAHAEEFSEAELYLELNDTDGDLGIHASIDGGPYTELEIEDTRGRSILEIEAAGRLAKQGLTQLFFESAEPSFDELEPEKFFQRFPEGEYRIEAERGRTRFEAMVELSHVLAAPVSNVEVSGIPAAEDCDADFLPMVSEPVVIDWDPVTTSHPELGRSGPVEIVRYQFFVEQGDVKFAVDLPPTVTQFQVPAEITALGGEFKFEIIARTADLNNTAVENCYIVP